MSPTMAMVPVKITPHGEISVLATWIGDVSNQRADVFLIIYEPLGIKMSNDCTSENVVTVVEVVVVVEGVAKVDSGVSRNIGR